MKIWNLKEVRKELNPDSKNKFRVWKPGIGFLPNVTYLKIEEDCGDIDLLVVDYIGHEVCCGTIGRLEYSGKLDLWNNVNRESKLCLNGKNRIVLDNNEITCDTGSIENKFKFKVWKEGILNEPDTTYFRLIEKSDAVYLIAVTSDGCINGAGYILKITEKGKLKLTSCISERLGLSLDSRRQLILNNSEANIKYG